MQSGMIHRVHGLFDLASFRALLALPPHNSGLLRVTDFFGAFAF
jgi:hypothetical protein